MATANFIKEKILWLLLPIGLLAMFVIVAGVPIGSPVLAIVVYLLPAITVWLFTAWTIGAARTMLLILAAGIIGGFFEFLGLTYGTFFGGDAFGAERGVIGRVGS